jgi:hypothetical protein
MNLKNKIILLAAGTFLSLAGLKLIFDPSVKSLGAAIALTGVLLDIISVVLIMKQEKWLDEA